MTLTEFLMARIAEDESEATLMSAVNAPSARTIAMTGQGMVVLAGRPGPFNPARVLAECAARRRIVEWHGGTREFAHPGPDGDPVIDVSCAECNRAAPCGTLRALASVYAGQADYDEAWKP